MEVILLENIENLGSVGDKVSVKSGFARNFLVPHGKAKIATAQNMAEFEARRAELESAAVEAKAEAETRQQAIFNETAFGAVFGAGFSLLGSAAGSIGHAAFGGLRKAASIGPDQLGHRNAAIAKPYVSVR